MEWKNNKVRIVYGDVVLGVHGSGFSVLFSYQTGGMESLVINGKEWLYRTPHPTFWRALTDNDRGNGFHLRSGIWLAADMYISCQNISVFADGEKIEHNRAPFNNKWNGEQLVDSVDICFEYVTLTNPATRVNIKYSVGYEGIRTEFKFHGKKGLPELPVVGIRFMIPTCAVGYRYEGLSGETYPDRKKGGVFGIHEVEGLPVTPYIVPQDCGMHMDTDWLEIFRNSTRNNADSDSEVFKIRIEKITRPFHFSCLPYTCEELENATHHEELPAARHTVLCIYSAVRGVGGVDSWGHDIGEAYHVSGEQDHSLQFYISLADTVRNITKV